MGNQMGQALLLAGSPELNSALYHRCRFLCGDPAAWVELESGERVFLVRDIERDRAEKVSPADRVLPMSEFMPPEGAGDRELGSALATAAFLKDSGVASARGDRTLPLMFADACRGVGIEVEFDDSLGVLERRWKDEQEKQWLREAQKVTEGVIARACETIARADAGSGGTLSLDGSELTSERVAAMMSGWLLEHRYENPICIVAGGPVGADCHERGSGPLRTGEPVIIDLFPRNLSTRYWGDCTRCVVHGDVPGEVAAMHNAVVEAKAAAIAKVAAGVAADAVHAETARVIEAHGYTMGGSKDGRASMVHGTGHGIGLAVHEPPLIDRGGIDLVEGDCVTIEPGLYKEGLGGIRIEDMILVTADGHENLNSIQEGLDWS